MQFQLRAWRYNLITGSLPQFGATRRGVVILLNALGIYERQNEKIEKPRTIHNGCGFSTDSGRNCLLSLPQTRVNL